MKTILKSVVRDRSVFMSDGGGGGGGGWPNLGVDHHMSEMMKGWAM